MQMRENSKYISDLHDLHRISLSKYISIPGLMRKISITSLEQCYRTRSLTDLSESLYLGIVSYLTS